MAKQRKQSIGGRVVSAMFKKAYGTKTTEQHEAYQRHVTKAKAAGKKPYTFKYWSREPVFFRGIQAARKKQKSK